MNSSNHLAKNASPTFLQKIKLFLNAKTGTLIAAAIGMCIGFAFKDFVSTSVSTIIEPLIVMIIYMSGLEKMYDFKRFLSVQNNTLNITKFIQTLITFIIILVVVYYFYQGVTA
jgi:large-conductance mechanosensitive channel